MPLKSLPSYSRREIGFIAQYEKVIHLDDFLLRRSMLAMLGRLTHEAVDEIAEALGESLDWEGEQRKDEMTRVLNLLEEKHKVRLGSKEP